jgi:chromosome segregation ATPase
MTGPLAPSASEVIQQNLTLSEKILQLRLAESRLTREAHLLNERVHFLGKVDEERETNVQTIEEESLRLRADQEAQLESLARKVRDLQTELLEARRALASAPKERKDEEGETRELGHRLVARRLLTAEQPKLAAQIEEDRKQIEANKEALLHHLDTIAALKLERGERRHREETLRRDLQVIPSTDSLWTPS